MRKLEEEYAQKACISLPRFMRAQARERQRTMGLTKFSDYVQHLIRTDLATPGAIAPTITITSPPQ